MAAATIVAIVGGLIAFSSAFAGLLVRRRLAHVVLKTNGKAETLEVSVDEAERVKRLILAMRKLEEEEAEAKLHRSAAAG